MSDTDDIKPDETDGIDTNPVDDPDGADKLDDPGKKALDAMKGKWHSERDRRKAAEQELAALKAQEGEDRKSDNRPDPDEIRKQAKAEAAVEVLRDRVMDKVETKAAKLFADPEDARALLASHVDDFIENGKVELDAIEEALDDLLKRKPHLAAQGGRRFQGSADGGARKGNGPAQLTRDDLKGMSPKEIVKAKAEGRLRDVLGPK